MSRALWTSGQAQDATRGRTTKFWRAHGVSIDSRKIARDDLFIALKGPTNDGHDFVAKALAAGAVAAMVSRIPHGVAAGASLLVVDDTRRALEGLGVAARGRLRGTVIAVTGSVGKTGTKEALRQILSRQAPCWASAESYNNHWGVPLSLARTPQETRFGVYEAGMNHAGELGPLARLIRPDVAIITNVEAAHIAHFPSIEAIADAKAEIFDGIANRGAAVLNRDSPFFDRLLAAAGAKGVRQIFSFGNHPDSWARAIETMPAPTQSRVRAEIGGQRFEFVIGLPGRHWVMNSLAVLAAVHAAGGDVNAAVAALADLEAAPGRGRRIPVRLNGGRVVVIDESYNANPASMRAAFETLGLAHPGRGGRRIAILGDMRELGKDSARYHADLAPIIVENGIEVVYTAGPDMAALHQALPEARRGEHGETSSEIAPLITRALKSGDVVMVKGSHGSRMDIVVDAIAQAGTALSRIANG